MEPLTINSKRSDGLGLLVKLNPELGRKMVEQLMTNSLILCGRISIQFNGVGS